MSNFHNITQNGSKMCHGSVTGVTCDTTWHGLPPFGLSPEAEKKEKRKGIYMYVTAGNRLCHVSHLSHTCDGF